MNFFVLILQGGKWTLQVESTCLPAQETTYTNTGYAATTILKRKSSYF